VLSSVKVDLIKTGCEDMNCIEMAQHVVQWRAFVVAVAVTDFSNFGTC
jgi:hypothetical protein